MSHNIELRVGDVSQLFDERDPSPLHEKDLSKPAEEFILGWARLLPGKQFDLRVHLERCVSVPNEQQLTDAIRAHFSREADATRRKLKRSLQLGRRSLLIGIAFLGLILTMGELLAGNRSGFLRLLGESMTIGGWVVMWRPLEFFLYDLWPVRADIRLLENLARAPVEIRCGQQQVLGAGG